MAPRSYLQLRVKDASSFLILDSFFRDGATGACPARAAAMNRSSDAFDFEMKISARRRLQLIVWQRALALRSSFTTCGTIPRTPTSAADYLVNVAAHDTALLIVTEAQ